MVHLKMRKQSPNFKYLPNESFSGLCILYWNTNIPCTYITILLISSQEKLIVIKEDENSAAEIYETFT